MQMDICAYIIVYGLENHFDSNKTLQRKRDNSENITRQQHTLSQVQP